jgi:hypothetical protein
MWLVMNAGSADIEGDKNGADLGVVVGLAVLGGIAYFAVVRCPDRLLLTDPLDRIVPTKQVDPPQALANFRDRVGQEFRRLQPRAVGVGFTRKYKNWKAQDAFRRFSLDATAMVAAVDLNIPCQQVRQEDAARAVGVAPAKLVEQAAAKLGINETKYWNERVWAIATALHVAQTHC